MGLTWKAMPLLSTLAALVIIVHSAEEDFEPDYRELRPRRYDTITPSYEQPWRVLDADSITGQTTQTDWDVSPEEEPPKRRRPVRKRKRRPLTTSEDDLIPQERQVYYEEYRPYQHEKFISQTGIVQRRRKQFDSRQTERPNSWTDETLDADRPLVRKRGHRRKRPSKEENSPQLSEFNSFTPNDNPSEYTGQIYNTQPTESITYGENHNYDNSGDVVASDYDERKRNKHNNYVKNHSKENIQYPEAENSDNSSIKKDEDKSISDLSLEIQRPNNDVIREQQKLSEKDTITTSDLEAAQSNKPLDQQTLKQILKRSNGKSLSEILQQHNLSLVDLLHGKEKAISILKMKDVPRNNSEESKGPPKEYARGDVGSSQIGMDKYAENNKNKKTINIQNSASQEYSIAIIEKIGMNNENKELNRENPKFKNTNTELNPKESVRNTIILKNVNDVQTVTNNDNLDITEPVTESSTEYITQSNDTGKFNCTEESTNKHLNIEQNVEATAVTTTKSPVRRRFPVGTRRKLRIRPMNNTTYKSQLSRDLIALTSRRYQISRNTTRSKEWKDVMPTMIKISRRGESKSNIGNNYYDGLITTISNIPEETTFRPLLDETKISTLPDITETDPSTMHIETDIPTTESSLTIPTYDITTTEIIPSTIIITTTTTAFTTSASTTTTTSEKPIKDPVLRPLLKTADLRRQAFNNRLKRKRLKQKTTTTESTQEYAMKDIFGMANLVSASEFIAKVQPRTTSSEDELDFTTLEDFITTEIPAKSQVKSKSTKIPKPQFSTTHTNLPIIDTEEESAKIEIEEILNDTRASARLSKILMERNMTINELVEHRERGSSHIHLADIFHNASREPNPPEPFLSKSLIEPISKETYPLRALLEANLHDPTAKGMSIEQNSTHPYSLNIPVVMDFGNNVNENGENMGIMSLFDNFTKISKMDTNVNDLTEQPTTIRSQDKNINVNVHGTSRESRILKTDPDLITWKEIIAIMHREQENNTSEVVEHQKKEVSPVQAVKKIVMEDSDGENMLNNFDHHHDLDNQDTSRSDEELVVPVLEKSEIPKYPSVLNKTSNSAKSVTVATASILGLAIILFLLTYLMYKWKQQRSLFNDKQTAKSDRIPTPVFENRKGHRNNSSTRSKSPMISSNIYNIDTLDARNGNDSPEYMWDSLRKPFQ